jgi:hypothetical protein
MAEDKDSSRTKMLKETPAEGGVKGMLKKALTGASRIADKVGFTQEKKYGGKTKEEMQKKAKGGSVKYRKGGSIDGCAVKGKTRGRMV